jgi:hypothetical protein
LIDDAHGKHACNCTYMYALTCTFFHSNTNAYEG